MQKEALQFWLVGILSCFLVLCSELIFPLILSSCFGCAVSNASCATLSFRNHQNGVVQGSTGGVLYIFPFAWIVAFCGSTSLLQSCLRESILTGRHAIPQGGNKEKRC